MMNQIFHLTLEPIFFGFAFYSFLFLTIPIFTNRLEKLFNNQIDRSATLVMRFAGIAFLILFVVGIADAIISIESPFDEYAISNRLFGPYAFGFWMYPIVYVGATQLLWIARCRRSRVIHWMVALLIVVMLSFERLIISITSLHRDYLPSSWSHVSAGYTRHIVLNGLINVLIFAIVVTIVHFTRISVSNGEKDAQGMGRV